MNIPSTSSASSPGPAGTGRTPPRTRGPVLARSLPLRLAIPAIGVQTTVQQLGLDPDGSVQVPPLGRDSHAGWYKYSPTPGELGPSVILGHIDSAAYGPGVFFRLGDLRQRDRISITLADHTVAVFEVERVVEYRKTKFPTLAVYGNTDHAALRLITCGGTFDPARHSYESDIVAYAALVSSHPY
jgi:sortase (surface protein transpeptidase)